MSVTSNFGTKPCFLSSVPSSFHDHPVARSGTTDLMLFCFTSHGGIELSAAHVGFPQAGAPQHNVSHQRELHIRPGQTGVLEAGRNEVCPA